MSKYMKSLYKCKANRASRMAWRAGRPNRDTAGDIRSRGHGEYGDRRVRFDGVRRSPWEIESSQKKEAGGVLVPQLRSNSFHSLDGP